MSDFELEPLILQLAEEFRRRDMRAHLDSLRTYYRGYRARKRRLEGMARPPWTEEMVISWLSIFQIAPFEHILPVLGRGAPCPKCRAFAAPQRPSVRSVFPGGLVRSCPACHAQWLELES